MSYKRIDKSLNDIDVKNIRNKEYKNKDSAFTRERKIGFRDFIWYLTFQKGRTTSMELDEYLKNKNGTYEISISKQAFSKQRLNLKPKIFIDLYKDYLIDFYHNYPEEVKTGVLGNVAYAEVGIRKIDYTGDERVVFKQEMPTRVKLGQGAVKVEDALGNIVSLS